MPRRRKLALSSYTPRRHSEESIFAAIRAAIPMNGVFWDYLTEERLIENFGSDEYERGVIEGGRRFAGRLQELATPQERDDAIS